MKLQPIIYKLQPIIYKLGCTSCVTVAALPIDIFQTKVLSGKEVPFNLIEIKWAFMMCFFFILQNSFYKEIKFISNRQLKSIFIGLMISPAHIIYFIKKYNNRLKLYPKKIFILWTIIKDILFYLMLHNLQFIKYTNLYLSSFIVNALCCPLKIIAIKSGYPSINMNFKSIKNLMILEIFKSSFSDGLALSLIR